MEEWTGTGRSQCVCVIAAEPHAWPGSSRAGLTVQVSTLVSLWIGGFLLFYGQSALIAALFPVALLVFMNPVPDLLLNAVIALLQRGSAEGVAMLFTLTGTPFYREDFVFALPGVVIHVTEECSGIRSSIALMLTALLAGHVYLTKALSKALLTAAILPIALVRNALRIVSITLLSIHVHPSFLTGRLHNDGGIVFFILALALLTRALVLIRRAEMDRMPQRCESAAQMVP